MKSEQEPNTYNGGTFPPQPLTSSDLALAIDAVCYWLQDQSIPGDKSRDMQRLRLKLMHHEICAEARERRVPA